MSDRIHHGEHELEVEYGRVLYGRPISSHIEDLAFLYCVEQRLEPAGEECLHGGKTERLGGTSARQHHHAGFGIGHYDSIARRTASEKSATRNDASLPWQRVSQYGMTGSDRRRRLRGRSPSQPRRATCEGAG